MTENQKIWWQYWTDITNIKPLNVMVGGPCLVSPLELSIPG